MLFSLSEGVGFALLLPTLQVAGLNLAGQGEAGRYSAIVTNAFVRIGMRPSLILLLGVFLMLFGARTVLGQIQNVWTYTVQQQIEHHLRRRIYRAIADANWLFVCRSRASDFTHALTHETYRVGNGTNLALVFAGEVNGNIMAFDAKSGEKLWSYHVGIGACTPPITYRVKAVQYLAVGASGCHSQESQMRRESRPVFGDTIAIFAIPR